MRQQEGGPGWRLGVHTLHTLHSTCAAAVHPCAAEVAQLWSGRRRRCHAWGSSGRRRKLCAPTRVPYSFTLFPCRALDSRPAKLVGPAGGRREGPDRVRRPGNGLRRTQVRRRRQNHNLSALLPSARRGSNQRWCLALHAHTARGMAAPAARRAAAPRAGVQATICGRAVAGSTHLRRWCCAQTAPPAAPPAAPRAGWAIVERQGPSNPRRGSARQKTR